MARLTRTALLERNTRQDRNVRRDPTSVRTIMILVMRDRGEDTGERQS